MTIGAALFLIATGAILKFAVDADVSGLEISTIGLILMIVGGVGLILALLYPALWSRRGVAYERDVVRERDVPRERTVVRDRDVY